MLFSYSLDIMSFRRYKWGKVYSISNASKIVRIHNACQWTIQLITYYIIRLLPLSLHILSFTITCKSKRKKLHYYYYNCYFSFIRVEKFTSYYVQGIENRLFIYSKFLIYTTNSVLRTKKNSILPCAASKILYETVLLTVILCKLLLRVSIRWNYNLLLIKIFKIEPY